jgi:hypothetical protein
VSKRDLPMRTLQGDSARLQRDVRDALGQLRVDVDRSSAYTPSTPADLASPAPTTIGDALDRLAAAGAAGTWPA